MQGTMSRTFTIRQLTKEFSVTARTLRFYEDEGMIAPERRARRAFIRFATAPGSP